MNCTSSTISTSTDRKICLKVMVSCSRSDRTKRYMNCSADRYSHPRLGKAGRAIPRRWRASGASLPRPTAAIQKQRIERRRRARPSATRLAAAWGQFVGAFSTMKSSKVFRQGFRVRAGQIGAPGAHGACQCCATGGRGRRWSPAAGPRWHCPASTAGFVADGELHPVHHGTPAGTRGDARITSPKFCDTQEPKKLVGTWNRAVRSSRTIERRSDQSRP